MIRFNGTWKKDFDSRSDALQQTLFGLEIVQKGFENTAQYYRQKEKEALQKAIAIKVDADRRGVPLPLKEETIRSLDIGIIKNLEVIFRSLKGNSKIGTLLFKNDFQGTTADFTFQCIVNGKKSRNLSISVVYGELKDVLLKNGKKASFVLGEQCDFFYKDEKVRSYTISTK